MPPSNDFSKILKKIFLIIRKKQLICKIANLKTGKIIGKCHVLLLIFHTSAYATLKESEASTSIPTAQNQPQFESEAVEPGLDDVSLEQIESDLENDREESLNFLEGLNLPSLDDFSMVADLSKEGTSWFQNFLSSKITRLAILSAFLVGGAVLVSQYWPNIPSDVLYIIAAYANTLLPAIKNKLIAIWDHPYISSAIGTAITIPFKSYLKKLIAKPFNIMSDNFDQFVWKKLKKSSDKTKEKTE